MDAFEGVEVWNMDVCNALKRVKNEIKEECTVYIDPPYLSAVNSNVKTDIGTYDHNSSRQVRKIQGRNVRKVYSKRSFGKY